MKKKTLLMVLTIASLLFITTNSFATNDIKNGIHNTTDSVIDGAERLSNDVKNGIGKASGAIENSARNLGNTISNGTQNIGNAISDDMDNNNNMYTNMNNNNEMNNMSNSNNGYTATRTTASDITDADIMNTNLWTWVALAVAGIVIIGLVWYYAAEHDVDR